MKKQKLKTNKGITLIALVITIIVMLILVTVTISMAVNGGLFNYARKAVSETREAKDAEQELSNLEVNMTVDELIDKYTEGELPEYSTDLLDSKTQVLTTNATFTSDGYTAVIPKGFKIVNGIEGTQSIANGLVIQDVNENEFVWIPVTDDIGPEYDSDKNGKDIGYYEPKELDGIWTDSSLAIKPKYDSQEILNELYPPNHYTFIEGMYANEYAKMVKSVNENDGFYIGRYETTIDSNGNIGSKYDTEVLTAGTTFTKESNTYYYRWYGLYNEQKIADVTGNGENVQTAMIYGVLWDKAMEFIIEQFGKGNANAYNVNERHAEWYGHQSRGCKFRTSKSRTIRRRSIKYLGFGN